MWEACQLSFLRYLYRKHVLHSGFFHSGITTLKRVKFCHYNFYMIHMYMQTNISILIMDINEMQNSVIKSNCPMTCVGVKAVKTLLTNLEQ